jgi:hypothetical protein
MFGFNLQRHLCLQPYKLNKYMDLAYIDDAHHNLL